MLLKFNAMMMTIVLGIMVLDTVTASSSSSSSSGIPTCPRYVDSPEAKRNIVDDLRYLVQRTCETGRVSGYLQYRRLPFTASVTGQHPSEHVTYTSDSYGKAWSMCHSIIHEVGCDMPLLFTFQGLKQETPTKQTLGFKCTNGVEVSLELNQPAPASMHSPSLAALPSGRVSPSSSMLASPPLPVCLPFELPVTLQDSFVNKVRYLAQKTCQMKQASTLVQDLGLHFRVTIESESQIYYSDDMHGTAMKHAQPDQVICAMPGVFVTSKSYKEPTMEMITFHCTNGFLVSVGFNVENAASIDENGSPFSG